MLNIHTNFELKMEKTNTVQCLTLSKAVIKSFLLEKCGYCFNLNQIIKCFVTYTGIRRSFTNVANPLTTIKNRYVYYLFVNFHTMVRFDSEHKSMESDKRNYVPYTNVK